jgi:hypothetical protein
LAILNSPRINGPSVNGGRSLLAKKLQLAVIKKAKKKIPQRQHNSATTPAYNRKTAPQR